MFELDENGWFLWSPELRPCVVEQTGNYARSLTFGGRLSDTIGA